MGQVNVVEIKETAEKGRDGKAKAAEKERGVNNGLMGNIKAETERQSFENCHYRDENQVLVESASAH